MSTPKDLETNLQLVYAYLTVPRRDENRFSIIIQRSKEGMANRETILAL